MGFTKFFTYALENNLDVDFYFEKITSSGKREDSTIGGKFKLEGRAKDLEEIRDEAELVKRKQKKRKK